MLLHIFRTHFQTDRNALNGRQRQTQIKTDLLTFDCLPTLNSCTLLATATTNSVTIFTDLEFPVVELPPWGVVVSEVSLHPDSSVLQSVQVFRALGQQSLFLLFWQGSCDPTWDDDNLLKGREM